MFPRTSSHGYTHHVELIILHVDDVNMPAPDTYGTQGPIELLRLLQSEQGFYDRKKVFWKSIQDTLLLLSAAPPGGGRNVVTPRFTSRTHLLCMPETSFSSLLQIFGAVLNGFLMTFKPDVQLLATGIVTATIDIYHEVVGQLLPTPARPHYTFNLRDVSKVFQGLLMVRSQQASNKDSFVRLWIHEILRVFGDRLVSRNDGSWLEEVLAKALSAPRLRSEHWSVEKLREEKILWGNFLRPGSVSLYYEEVQDVEKVRVLLQEYNEERVMNASGGGRGSSGAGGGAGALVFFHDAIEHVVRIARVLSQPRGSLLLVGVGGSGRQTLTRLASSMYDQMTHFEVELTRGYGVSNFREDELTLLKLAGMEVPAAAGIGAADDVASAGSESAGAAGGRRGSETGAGGSSKRGSKLETEPVSTILGGANKFESGMPTCFLLNDSQIVSETFLEDVNSLLNGGEVPNLFQTEQMDEVVSALRPICKDLGRSETRDDVWLYFVERVRFNLHLVLAISPVGDQLRTRLRVFPSLVYCTTIDWFHAWPVEALHSVAENLLVELSMSSVSGGGPVSGVPSARGITDSDPADPDQGGSLTKSPSEAMSGQNRFAIQLDQTAIPGLCEAFVEAHTAAATTGSELVAQLGRHVYVTPKSYLDLIALYIELLAEKQRELLKNRDRLAAGVDKIREANDLVAQLQQELDRMRPQIQIKISECLDLIPVVRAEQERAEAIQEKVGADEAVVRGQQQEAAQIQAEAQKDLSKAMPALEAAVRALDALDKKDITEVKSFAKPPPLVMLTMEAVNTLLGEKTDWDSAKRVLTDFNFLSILKNYDKDNIEPGRLKKLAKYIQKPEYSPEEVGKTSRACKSLCMWTHAVHTYSAVAKEVAPKKLKLAELNARLEEADLMLREKQRQLFSVLQDVESLRNKLSAAEAEKEALIAESSLTEDRLLRADVLTRGLSSESKRWNEEVVKLNEKFATVTGDIFLAAAVISYAGPFPSQFRAAAELRWQEGCQKAEVPCASLLDKKLNKFDLVETLGSFAEQRQWVQCGLPADSVSRSNAIMAVRGKRWPLMIDPQGQANKWVRRRGILLAGAANAAANAAAQQGGSAPGTTTFRVAFLPKAKLSLIGVYTRGTKD